MRHKNNLVHYGMLGFIYGVAALTLAYHTAFHNISHAQAPSCARAGNSIIVNVSDTVMTPANISVKRCDVLSLVNTGKAVHLLAFGEHEHHSSYAGFHEAVLKPGQTIKLPLAQTGTYEVHDHLNEELQTSLRIE